ncbi:hypothetical protein JCM10213_002180 [Rhodosporidiobolus nylandii]
MAAPPPPSFDYGWSSHAQAPSHADYYGAGQSAYGDQGAAYDAPAHTDASASSGAEGDVYGGGGLRIDSYAASAYTFAPERSTSHGTTPSPALAALSPASSLSTSSGFVSPQQFFSAANSPEQYRTGLLPPAHVQDGAVRSTLPFSAPAKGNTGRFAEMQESFLQDHHSQQPSLAPSCSHTLHPSPSLQTPATPRRNTPSSAHLWRSPTSVTSSPGTSPYARPVTPRTASVHPSESSPRRSGRRSSTGGLESPSKRAALRRSQGPVTVSVDANGSPTKTVRRTVRLSIEVPAHGSTSPARAQPPSQPVFGSGSSKARLSAASVREVEQLLDELGPILESSPAHEQLQETVPPSRRGMQRVELIPPPGSPVRQSISASSYAQPALSASMASNPFAPTTISISGVTLAEEDLALLDTPSLGGDGFSPTSPAQGHRSYPSSAPAWRTTFDLAPPLSPSRPAQPSDPQSAYQQSYYAVPSSLAYTHSALSSSLAIPQQPQHPHDPFRPSSAPRDPLPDMSPFTGSSRRRRSSVDSAALQAAAQRRPYQYPPPNSYSNYAYSRPPPPPSSQQNISPHDWYSPETSHFASWQQQPRFPPQMPIVLQPVPPPQPDRPATPPPAPLKSPKKASPRKKRPSKAKPPGAMFINYSSADSKKLLSGVAPSGSIKKRQLEEEAARLAAEEAAQVQAQATAAEAS